ncbi:MAG: alpha/beta hydrolase [Oscillospiraceae bacterium]|nr:alpha/beta hydrolase [Oscillospiraceae bacterium]
MHREYRRIAEHPTVGILVVHGITSTPNHFRDLLGLIPGRFSVHALLLDGHGKTVKDVRPVMVPIALKFSRGKADPTDPLLEGFAQSYSIAPDKNPFHYLGWLPRFLELLFKSRKTRKLIPKINCPTVVFQSQKDELVSMKSCDCFRDNPNITLQILPHSGHCYYPSEDLQLLQSSFTDFLLQEA